MGRNQLTLEIQSAQARHPHIKNQARCIVQLIRIQKRFRRRETLCPKSHGSDQIVERFPERSSSSTIDISATPDMQLLLSLVNLP